MIVKLTFGKNNAFGVDLIYNIYSSTQKIYLSYNS